MNISVWSGRTTYLKGGRDSGNCTDHELSTSLLSFSFLPLAFPLSFSALPLRFSCGSNFSGLGFTCGNGGIFFLFIPCFRIFLLSNNCMMLSIFVVRVTVLAILSFSTCAQRMKLARRLFRKILSSSCESKSIPITLIVVTICSIESFPLLWSRIVAVRLRIVNRCCS